MNISKRFLSMFLVLCMFIGLMPMTALAAGASSTEHDYQYNIVHVDAGRKYFSPANLKAIIDNAAAAGFNQVELYLSDNQGFRFALDDMTITTSYGTYDLTDALGDGYTQSDGKAPDGSGKYLTQSEMTDIIAYANAKGIDIVPCINVPGHMGAILEEFTSFRYTKSGSTSKSSIDLDNAKAVAFALALTEKYAAYFASQGCKYYNVGADEYANDLSSMGFEGMGQTLYNKFVQFLNDAADIVIGLGMTPRAFNDGFYYKDYTCSGINTAYEICYWSSGWNGYDVAAASTLRKKGFKMINTHGDYYWVLGNSSWQCSASKASQFDETVFQGSTISDPAGSMFCIWCDNGSADTGANVVSKTAPVIAAFGAAVPDVPVTVSDSASGIVVKAADLTGLTVEAAIDPEIEGAEKVCAWNITPKTASGSYTGSAVIAVPVPEGWNTARMRGFVMESNGSATLIPGSVNADGNFQFTMPHFSVGGVLELAEETVEVTENKTITVSVGKTETAVITGANYSGNYTASPDGIAEISAEYEQVAGGTVETVVTSINTGEAYYIKNSSGQFLTSDAEWTSNIADAVKWTVTERYSGYRLYYDDVYLRYNNGSLTTSSYNPTTFYFENNMFVYSSGWSSYTLGSAIEVTTTAPVDQTTVTFTGVKVGTTYVTVGNTRYTINVVAEDLSTVTPLTVEYWITNNRVTANGSTSMTIAAADAYGEKGVEIAKLIPATGVNHDNKAVAYWKTTCLDSDNEQTLDAGDNETLDGADFIYIRYYGGKWAYSSSGTIWTNILSTDQIVAYYLQITQITDEVTTQVVDWGVTPSTDYDSTNFVLVDFAVCYESGERTPTAFPVSGKTMAFHCDPGDKNTVHQYNNGSSSTWSNNYRDIYAIFGMETAEYDVYMITVTPTSSSRTTQVAGNANRATSYTYDYETNEMVIWVDDEANLGNFADKKYTSISGKYTYSSGGEPIVPGLEIFNRHGMLVTYYVRAKATQSALNVHYIDATEGANNLEFYTYSIAVKEGTTFKPNIGLANPWKGNLVNATVTNYYDRTQTVSADLSTLSQIGAQYLYSEYTCIRVECSTDGKDVYLYYTFDPTVYFVADFGLPIQITAADLNASLTDSIVSDMLFTGTAHTKYGVLTDNGTTITYAPDEILQGIDFFTLIVKTNTNVDGILDSASNQIAFRVYIVPATTVYYDESFIKDFTGSWTRTGAAITTGPQATVILGKSANNNFGYDSAYANQYDSANANQTGASNGTSISTSTIGDNCTFTFTGTGIQVFANCTEKTGRVAVTVKNSAGKIVSMSFVDTVVNSGDTNATTGQTGAMYGLPIVSLIELNNLKHDQYTVTITKILDAEPVSIDGIRVFGTIKDSSIFADDLEDNPDFYEMRDMVLNAFDTSNSIDEDREQVYKDIADALDGDVAIITGSIEKLYPATDPEKAPTLQDLLDNGPKNELFLYPGQTLTFKVTTERVAQIGLKAPNGAVNANITTKIGETIVTNTDLSIKSSVDMFYDLIEKDTENTYTVSITNSGSPNILSVTLLKICDDPNAAFVPLDAEDIAGILGVEVDEDIEDKEPEEDVKEEEPEEDEKVEIDFENDEWFWDMLNLVNSKFAIIAEAHEGGSISKEGVTYVKYYNRITYTITPDEGYEVESVIVDGEDVGAVRRYTFRQVKDDHTISVKFKAIDEAAE